MKFSLAIIVMVGASAGLMAEAQDAPDFGPLVFEPWCARSYRSESYGLGIGSGYGIEQVVPSTMDERCYQLGSDVGETIRQEHGTSKSCRVAFLRGMAQGLEASPQSIDSPSDCSNAGYSFGRAKLENAARRKLVAVVGEECLAQYRAGYEHAEDHLAPVMPSFDNRLNACYLTGYDDGAFSD